MNLRWIVRVALALSLRPLLWSTACRQAHRLARRSWWRRHPFLPIPATAYGRFRAVTQYGDPARRPDVADVVTWLVWVKDLEHTCSRTPGELSDLNY